MCDLADDMEAVVNRRELLWSTIAASGVFGHLLHAQDNKDGR